VHRDQLQPGGSAAGREDHIAGMDDFAASDVAFRNGKDKLGGTRREVVPYGFSCIPDVAGGTAFPYHIFVRGHLIRNLRLSARTLMKIFTGRITNWDNPQITRDYGTRLPNLPITPVLHSEGSGVTYFLTNWMARQFSRRWNAFCERVRPGLKPPCGPTEFYPIFGSAKSENGSNNVIGYITSRYGNGSIGYDEYAYPLGARGPLPGCATLPGVTCCPSPSGTRQVTRYPAAATDRAAQRQGQDTEHLRPFLALHGPEANYEVGICAGAGEPRTGWPIADSPYTRSYQGRPVPVIWPGGVDLVDSIARPGIEANGQAPGGPQDSQPRITLPG
jgi:hypothetical protein